MARPAGARDLAVNSPWTVLKVRRPDPIVKAWKWFKDYCLGQVKVEKAGLWGGASRCSGTQPKSGVREEGAISRSAGSHVAAGPGSMRTEDFPLDTATRAPVTWQGARG